jgi:hypothetical protein
MPFARVVRTVFDGHLRAFRKGGGHAGWWILVLDCGHAQHASSPPGVTPTRPRKCHVCSYIAEGRDPKYRQADSDRLLAQIDRKDP